MSWLAPHHPLCRLLRCVSTAECRDGEVERPHVAERAAACTETVDGFVPPFPYRWPRPLSPWQRLRIARKNLIAQFEDAAFELDFTSVKILSKRIFVCNSPQTVQWAFGIKNELFERKSPAMRHMLK